MLFLHDIYHIIRMEQDNLYNLLQSIDTPDDLRHLSADKLPEVCKEYAVGRSFGYVGREGIDERCA